VPDGPEGKRYVDAEWASLMDEIKTYMEFEREKKILEDDTV